MFTPPVLLCAVLAASPTPLDSQSPDSVDLLDQARGLQRRFERRRVLELPRALTGGSRECDEIIGRLCVWDEGDDERALPSEPAEIGQARRRLLADLAALAESIPGDQWIFGQRIRYLTEAGELEDAQALATLCGLPDRWRCDAYLGFSLHLDGRTAAAARAFDRALAAMPADLAAAWTNPEPVLDGPLREWLSEQPDSAQAVARLWTLADPLFLVPGNDRWTGHLARWTYAMSSEDARNPHGMRWAEDLTEAAVRYGWSVAWEKGWPRGGEAASPVVGRDPPAAVRTFPSRDILEPSENDAVPTWTFPRGHARTAYLSPHLDSLGALDGQIGRFWRRDRVVVVAAAAPGWPESQAGFFVHEGSFVLDLRAPSDAAGAVRLAGSVPHAEWGVASLEAWDPDRRRGQRLRVGMSLRPVPPDVFALSDLVFIDAPAEENAPAEEENAPPAAEDAPAEEELAVLGMSGSGPTTLDEAIGVLRTRTEVASDEALGIAVEVYGLGYHVEPVGFRAWVEDRNPSAFRRLARRLGLAGSPEIVSVQWDEAGPDRPGPILRAFAVRLPKLDAGAYDLVVEVSAPGRLPLSRRRAFTVPASR